MLAVLRLMVWSLTIGTQTIATTTSEFLYELDYFIKRELREKYYIRYADDFVIINQDKTRLESLIPKIDKFLNSKLDLRLHPEKMVIKRWHQGIDFLGYIVFPHYTILRTKTKQRIFKKIRHRTYQHKMKLISKESFSQGLQSYFGILKHCRGYEIKRKIRKIILAP